MSQSNAPSIGVVDGTSGKDKIKGKYKDSDGDRVSNGSDIISSGAGNDFVNAGKGNDTIIYTSGNDTYIGGKGFDSLDLTKYQAHEVTFSYKGKHVIIETPDGKITLKNQKQKKLETGKVMEEVVFSDGTLDEAAIQARAVTDNSVVNGTSGNDIINVAFVDGEGNSIGAGDKVISSGAGDDTIQTGQVDDVTVIYTSGNDIIRATGSNDTLDLSKYDLEDISARFDGGFLFITTPDGEITVARQNAYNEISPITSLEVGFEHFIFNDQMMSEEEFSVWVTGQQGEDGVDDTIYASNQFYATVNGTTGDDHVRAGHSGTIYIYKGGDDDFIGGKGNDTLDLSKYSIDEVSFAPAFSGDDTAVAITTPDGVVIATLDNAWWGRGTQGYNYAVESFVFSDGTLTKDDVFAKIAIIDGTDGDDIINTAWEDDEDHSLPNGQRYISSGAGNDTIQTGQVDDVTVIYTSGNDRYSAAGVNDTLDLSKYDLEDITAVFDPVGNLVITTPDGEIFVRQQNNYRGSTDTYSELGFDTFVLNDQTMTEEEFSIWVVAQQGTDGNEALEFVYGSEQFDATINGTSGNDHVDGGNNGSTYIYKSGNDIYVGGDGIDTLDLSKYSMDEVSFAPDINGDDTVLITTPDGVIKTGVGPKGVGHSGNLRDIIVDRYVFSDGTLTNEDIHAQIAIVDGTDGNDTINATFIDVDGDQAGNGNDTISAGAGDDFAMGLGGDDTFIYTSGNDTYVGGEGYDTVTLSQFNLADVSVEFTSIGQMVVTRPNGTVTINAQAGSQSTGEATGRATEEFVFADQTVDAATLGALAVSSQGTTGDDIIIGAHNVDGIFNGSAGNDQIEGRSGDDTFIYHSGDDTFFAGYGEDTLDLSKYELSEVTFDRDGDTDTMVIHTPDGSVTMVAAVQADYQFQAEHFIFEDQVLSNAQVMELYDL